MIIGAFLTGILTGWCGILLYKRFSDQDYIAKLKKEASHLSKAADDSEDPSESIKLAMKSARCSMKLAGRMVLPAIISLIPLGIGYELIVRMPGNEEIARYFHLNVREWVYMLSVSSTYIGLKVRYKLK